MAAATSCTAVLLVLMALLSVSPVVEARNNKLLLGSEFFTIGNLMHPGRTLQVSELGLDCTPCEGRFQPCSHTFSP